MWVAFTGFSQTDCIVIDPFGGTHVTAVAAWTLGCKYIGVDLDDWSPVLLGLRAC